MPHLLPRQLATPRLRLREPVASDARDVFNGYAQDAQVCRFMVWRPHPSESVTRTYIEWCVAMWRTGERLPYVITQRDSDVAIGAIEARPQGTMVDIGYVLARAYWGQGLMPEAIRALADTALADAAIFRVQAACDVENIPSQRALEKAGFAREGRLERYTVHPNVSPEPRPCFMYAKCR